VDRAPPRSPRVGGRIGRYPSEFGILNYCTLTYPSEFGILNYLHPRAGINRVFVSAVHLDWVANVISTKRWVKHGGHLEGKRKCVIDWPSSGWVF